MNIISQGDLTQRIIDFVKQQGSCLFAGAGTSIKAGLPSWREYLEHLVTIAGKYESLTAELMKKRMSTMSYLEAAQYYRDCIEIPEGEKLKNLAAPFSTDSPRYSPANLHALVALPFSNIVTTNYDRAIWDAYYNLYQKRVESGLRLPSPLAVELGDQSMRQAIYWEKFYIARIHGREEIPDSIILSKNDYQKLLDNSEYHDFLLHVLKDYRCLWLGYSFLDPAIHQILSVMEASFPKPYPKLHMALLPDDSDKSLKAKLAAFNIEVVIYHSRNGHMDLWQAIKEAQRSIRNEPRHPPGRFELIPGMLRYLASSYTRLKLRKRTGPLIEITIEGIVSQSIVDAGSSGIDKNSLCEKLKTLFSVPDFQLLNMMDKALCGLEASNLCNIENDLITCAPIRHDNYQDDLSKLVSGVIHRLKVREGIDADTALSKSIRDILEKLFLLRGWDLGAHFAGAKPSAAFDAWSHIEQLVKNFAGGCISSAKNVSNAILDLLRHPDTDEACLLSDIGRISFSVELVINNSRASSSLGELLPKVIYLDANVLMPAIVEGHPYSSLYADAISKLQEAAKATGNHLRILIAKEFLNEIVSHRRISVDIVNEHSLHEPDNLERHVMLYGANNINVFIGGYSSLVSRRKHRMSYFEYLGKYAPYTNEGELAQYLEKRSVDTINIGFSEEETKIFHAIKSELFDAYENYYSELPYASSLYRKPRVLIEHEARQLSQLFIDGKLGRKPLFVTADSLLLRICSGNFLGKCSSSMLSHLGFIQLIDLVLGIEADRNAISRLIWNVSSLDQKTNIRNYLIDLALRHYDEAMTFATWEIIDKISEEAVVAADAEGVALFKNTSEDIARNAEFLDRFERSFFENMAYVIKKWESED